MFEKELTSIGLDWMIEVILIWMIFNKIKKGKIHWTWYDSYRYCTGRCTCSACMYRCGRHACVMLFHWYSTRTRTLGSRLLKRYTFNYLNTKHSSKKVFSLPPRLYIHWTNSEHLNFVPECKYVLQNILFEYSNILVEYSYVFHVSNFRTKLKYRL